MPYINDVLAENAKRNGGPKPDRPPGRMSRFRFNPDEVVALLESRIVGQPEMHASVADMLHVVKADFGARERPLAVFLLVGSTGVGKTETVRVLAEAILGGADRLCRIDMNTLAQEHYAAALTGAPPGYVGSKENHTLFDPEKIAGSYSQPGIVLFDEVEKADKQVARVLLNVLDSATLELSAGTKRLDFSNSLLFMTSNEGARELDAYRLGFERGWRKFFRLRPSKAAEKRILDTALQRRFDLEFINRIDRIIHFDPLGSDLLDDILAVELAQLNKRLAKLGATLRLDAAARGHLIDGHDKRFGARHLRRRIRTLLEPPLARALNRHPDADAFLATLECGLLEISPDE